ncbi:ExbD/TolR family protein [Psychroflexus planctonicus]|uniref:Biopolymer transporter ExbD n=1 Tax=Psychroflexus planctonicus TaxID=1526575 RepID=A0ABQ1SF16_9FLAO|nr:biopolymer transporter ExbD [Psychroflexus planctonicus]GGE25106.1 biopolymer transporter ExbD [Psychroflexus planctonicus]
MARRNAPEVNAGSMADIAFLLLIFFLVTTTIETDSGISRKLPPIDDTDQEDVTLKERNIFEVLVDDAGNILVEDKLMEVENLREAAIQFLDNGGGKGDEACNYCRGARDPDSSDNPVKAVISLQNNRQTKYKNYITVQNELVAAYNFLRNREAKRLFKTDFTAMEAAYNDPEYPKNKKEKLEERIKIIKEMYPQKLSEAEPKR